MPHCLNHMCIRPHKSVYCPTSPRTTQRGKFSLRRALAVDDAFAVEDVRDGAASEPHQARFAWRVISRTKTLLLAAATEAEKRAWLSDLERCIAESGRWQQRRRSLSLSSRSSVEASESRCSDPGTDTETDDTAEAEEEAAAQEAKTAAGAADARDLRLALMCACCFQRFSFFRRRHWCAPCSKVRR